MPGMATPLPRSQASTETIMPASSIDTAPGEIHPLGVKTCSKPTVRTGIMLSEDAMRGAVLLLAIFASACATEPRPPAGTEDKLYRDLERLVSLSDSAGWQIDRLELDGMLESALLSVCRVDTASTAALA